MKYHCESCQSIFIASEKVKDAPLLHLDQPPRCPACHGYLLKKEDDYFEIIINNANIDLYPLPSKIDVFVSPVISGELSIERWKEFLSEAVKFHKIFNLVEINGE